MACDVQTLLTDSKCFLCLSEKQLMGAVAYGWCVYIDNIEPPVDQEMLTEGGDYILTEGGDVIYLQ